MEGVGKSGDIHFSLKFGVKLELGGSCTKSGLLLICNEFIFNIKSTKVSRSYQYDHDDGKDAKS